MWMKSNMSKLFKKRNSKNKYRPTWLYYLTIILGGLLGVDDE